MFRRSQRRLGVRISHISSLSSSLTMLVLRCGFLLTHILSLVLALSCNLQTQYEWPSKEPQFCCNKCEAGQRMTDRCKNDKESNTKCVKCEEDYFRKDYNNEMTCKRCTQCTKKNMVYKKNCTSRSDAECGCKLGYKCDGDECERCVQLPPPPPTTPTPTPMTTMTTTTKQPPVLTGDSVWISLSLSCACVCFLLTCFILVSRPTTTYGRNMSTSSVCFLVRKKGSTQSSQCTEEDEEDEVPMPVQEEAGKMEWQV